MTPGDQELGDQAPVALLPGRLGAHEARGRPGEFPVEGLLPLGRSHPGRVAAERGHPETVELVLAWLAASPPAEFHCMAVDDPGGGEGLPEWSLVELRVAS